MNISPRIAAALRMIPSLPRDQAVVYFLRLKSGAIHVGCSNELEEELDDHFAGRVDGATQSDLPEAVLRIEIYLTLSEANRRETELRRWSRAKKEALVAGDSREGS